MHILITGTPGSGKTTLTQYAKSIKDKRFFDADEMPKLCEWREFDIGKVIGYVMEQKGLTKMGGMRNMDDTGRKIV